MYGKSILDKLSGKTAPANQDPIAALASPLRVVIYVRENMPQSPLLDQHLATVKGYCEAQGFEVVGHYVGDGEGNSPGSRPMFEAALSAIKRGDADALAVAELNQMAKTVPYLLEVLENNFEHGPICISTAERIQYPHTAGPLTRVLFQYVMAVMAKSSGGTSLAVPSAVQRESAPAPKMTSVKELAAERLGLSVVDQARAEIRKEKEAQAAEARGEETIKRNQQRGHAAFLAAALEADKARREGPSVDERIAENRRLLLEQGTGQ